MTVTIAVDHAPTPRRSDHAQARDILRSAAHHCADEGVQYSLVRWHGWAEFQTNRRIPDNLFEDLVSNTDMAVSLESGHLDFTYYHFADKGEAVRHFTDEADYYLNEILGGF